MNLHQFSLGRRPWRSSAIRGLPVLLVIAGLYLIARSSHGLSNPLAYVTDAYAEPSPSRVSTPKPLALPEADEFPLEANQGPGFCSDRYSMRYLDYLREHSIQYCTPDSESNLTCFHSHTQKSADQDSFCVGFGAVLQPSGTFDLGCQIRAPDKNETDKGLIAFQNIRSYWYDTGPGYVFANYVGLSGHPASATMANERGFVVLIKREGAGHVWHNLMELWSLTLTLDTLRLAPDDKGGPIFRYPEDTGNTQVIILDDYDDGPVFDLWTIFAGRKPVRLKQIMSDPTQRRYFQTQSQNLIVPLAGASNPLWQNDWTERDCQQATLLKIFVRRVMKHYKLEYRTAVDGADKKNGEDIILTFINRTGTRKLKNQSVLLDAIKKKYEHVKVQIIDFSLISFSDQLRLAQETDILVGVHGAGLTHTMFMREGAGAVVEILPDGLQYKGFRNLAVMTGHGYFTATAGLVSTPEAENAKRSDAGNSLQERGIGKRDKWHWSDVSMDEETFMKLIDDAVESLYKAQPHGQ